MPEQKPTKKNGAPGRGGRPPWLCGAAGGATPLAPRHKAGIAVRFPRILRRRFDKPVEEADTLDTLKGLLAAAGA